MPTLMSRHALRRAMLIDDARRDFRWHAALLLRAIDMPDMMSAMSAAAVSLMFICASEARASMICASAMFVARGDSAWRAQSSRVRALSGASAAQYRVPAQRAARSSQRF